MFDDILEEVSLVFNSEDIYYKFNEWKRHKGKNILLITGLSGSGKTTLTGHLAEKYNAKVLNLDAFDDMALEHDRTGVIRKFFELNKIEPGQYKQIWHIPGITYEDLFRKFFRFACNEFHKDSKNLYIIEGLQIYVYIENSEILRFPLVIKGTSYLVSNIRRIKRRAGNFMEELIYELKNYGLDLFKVGLDDVKKLKSLRVDMGHPHNSVNESANILQNKPNHMKGYDGMFGDLLRETSMPNEYYLPDDDGKIKAFEDAFGDDEIKKCIAYGFSSSHEYDEPDKKILAVKSCIKFVNNYDWQRKDLDVDKIESFNKPLNMKKVYDIAKTIEKKGNTEPLIVVDKIHGFNWQSRGKVILTDGNHRLGAIKILEMKKTPVYHGVYTGNAEKDHEEFIPSDENDDVDEEVIGENYIPDKLFEETSIIKDFFIESTNTYKMLRKGLTNRLRISRYNAIQKTVNRDDTPILFEGGIDKCPLTPSEQEAVEEKYGKVDCSFAKNAKNGKYFCYTHRARSKFYDSPTDIPVDAVKFISSTA